MFCEQCGTKLLETSDVCPRCNNGIKHNNTIVNNVITLLEVKPTVRFSCIFFPKLLNGLKLWFFIFVTLMIVNVFKITSAIKSQSSEDISNYMLILKIYLIIFLVILMLKIIQIIFKSLLSKKQNENYRYLFCNDKVIMQDQFLNISEKYVKYVHIREIIKTQSILERFFKIGTIKLYTTAESGNANGLFMTGIEDIDNIYKKVKEIISNRGE